MNRNKQENHERRLVSRDTAEIRVEEREDGSRQLTGKAVPYGSWSDEHFGFGGTFREQILPDAFDVADRDILVTVEHDNALLLGRTGSGTAKLETRKDGIYYSVSLPDTQAGRDVAELVKRGDIRGNSFEFVTKTDTWDGNDRTVAEGELFQVGPVASPFYESETSVALRSREAAAPEQKDAERETAEALRIALDTCEASVIRLK